MRKVLLAALITTAGICLVIGGCKPKDPDYTVTNWKHFISKADALVLIERLAKAIDSNGIRKSQLTAAIDNNGIGGLQLPKSSLYSEAQSMMRNMMLRDSCAGMRVYYGLTLNNKIVPIICGVNSKGDDIYWRRPLPEQREGTARALKDPAANDASAAAKDKEEDGLCDMSQPEPPPPSAITRYLIQP